MTCYFSAKKRQLAADLWLRCLNGETPDLIVHYMWLGYVTRKMVTQEGRKRIMWPERARQWASATSADANQWQLDRHITVSMAEHTWPFCISSTETSPLGGLRAKVQRSTILELGSNSVASFKTRPSCRQFGADLHRS